MRPVFLTRNVVDTGYSKILKEQHIRFTVSHQQTILNGIGFNMAADFPLLASRQPLDIIYTVDMNEWAGNRSIQLKVIDFRKHEAVPDNPLQSCIL